MKLNNLNIGTRLALAFGVMCAALVLIAGLAVMMMKELNDSTTELANRRMPRIAVVNEMLSNVNEIAIATRNMMLYQAGPDRDKQAETIAVLRKEVDGIMGKLDTMLKNPRSRDVLTKQQAVYVDYSKVLDRQVSLIQTATAEEAQAYLYAELRPALINLKATMRAQQTVQQELADELAAEAADNYASTQIVMLLLGVFGVLGAAWLAWWITRSITQPLGRALEVANTVAAGDLTSRIDVVGKDETSRLLLALKTMNESLVRTVVTVRNSTDTIGTAAAEVAAGNLDLSARTEQQASSLEETASSMEELTSTVKQNADNARQANVLAGAASQVAERGGRVIGEVVGTMSQISSSSNKIADIIGTIDGIAFQTNILALNAAVEAARAGEQGRGFAVVATEVRNLAQRSAAAAKEVKILIGDSAEAVQAGNKLVDEAGSTMHEIVESVRRVTDIMSEITAASLEQTAGIEQINEAVTQMDQVTQQNAALVEEAAAASGSMQDQAVQLANAVSVFRVDSADMQAHTSGVATSDVATPRLAPQVVPRKALVKPPSKAQSKLDESDWETF